ncbi:unnamed protein product [Brachionus calyciflorus]|uniref:ISXO2-like transposase domain-containing protein n=1 Tax=Brachionus calyciflorus TaxID=104777 RepID=A0A814NM67_9BILA|nr:unnamed protein product [Brachionus calyciflorus]
MLVHNEDLGREQVWVLGLVERPNSDNESKCYLEIVKNRDALTLIKIICNTCEPETLIFSDSWSSYNKIKSSVEDLEDQFITKLSTKERAKLYEIKSNEKPSSSNETVEQIKKVLSNKQDPLECPEFGKYRC